MNWRPPDSTPPSPLQNGVCVELGLLEFNTRVAHLPRLSGPILSSKVRTELPSTSRAGCHELSKNSAGFKPGQLWNNCIHIPGVCQGAGPLFFKRFWQGCPAGKPDASARECIRGPPSLACRNKPSACALPPKTPVPLALSGNAESTTGSAIPMSWSFLT